MAFYAWLIVIGFHEKLMEFEKGSDIFIKFVILSLLYHFCWTYMYNFWCFENKITWKCVASLCRSIVVFKYSAYIVFIVKILCCFGDIIFHNVNIWWIKIKIYGIWKEKWYLYQICDFRFVVPLLLDINL